MPIKIAIDQLQHSLDTLLGELIPGAVIEKTVPLSEPKPDQQDGTAKFLGYGESLRVILRTASGERRQVVFRTSRSDDFGHDRRSDRAGDALLAFDTFGLIPGHVSALDVGAMDDKGHLHSLRHADEFYLLTDYVEGAPYADDLWKIGQAKTLDSRDTLRCEMLTDYLVSLHARKIDRPGAYRRAIRDLVGHGEGIFGLVDSYPDDVPGVPLSTLQSIEQLCAGWRFRMRGREGRLARTHGDFHPFNILFDQNDRLAILDASRGCLGDPADDISCLSINYIFFALEHDGSWRTAFHNLWSRLWETYLRKTADAGVLEAVPPYLAWRSLVLCNPLWYPNARRETREALIGLVKQALEQGHFEPRSVERLFR